MKTAEAIAYGAATVVNAISTGKGAAIGVNLWTRARIELNQHAGKITASIRNDPEEPTDLIVAAATRILRRSSVGRRIGAHVETVSNIPIARGMKSSSVAANAVTLAATAALSEKIDDGDVVEQSVESAIAAKVTITGAFDDASASYFGGLVVTDNRTRTIIRRRLIPDDYYAIFHIPLRKSYTANLDLRKFRKVARVAELSHNLAIEGRHWEALIMNGMAHSVALGWNPNVALDAMEAGALASGLTGKGPATVAIAEPRRAPRVRSAMSRYKGKVVEARLNNRKAHVIECS